MTSQGFRICGDCQGAGDVKGVPCDRCFCSGEVEVFKPNRYVRKPVAEGVEQLGLDL